MTIKDLLKDYLREKVGAMEVIRQLSGAFNPEGAVDRLAIICSIARVEEGDLDKKTFESIYGLND